MLFGVLCTPSWMLYILRAWPPLLGGRGALALVLVSGTLVVSNTLVGISRVESLFWSCVWSACLDLSDLGLLVFVWSFVLSVQFVVLRSEARDLRSVWALHWGCIFMVMSMIPVYGPGI